MLGQVKAKIMPSRIVIGNEVITSNKVSDVSRMRFARLRRAVSKQTGETSGKADIGRQ
jgi:hypothetical protein